MRVIYRFSSLIGFILRRDRLYLLLWIVGLTAFATIFAPLMPEFLQNRQSSVAITQLMNNPAMVALIGISYGDGMGAMYALFMLVWSTMAAGVFNILFVVRHTRASEELGRNEIIASLPVGRNANLLAVILVAFAANVLVAALTTLALTLFGVQGMGFEGAFVYGAAMGAGGFAFAALAAVFSQIFSSSRATLVWAFSFLGAAYLLRAFGDLSTGPEIAALVSPLGLVERVQAWVVNETWPVWLLLAEAFFLTIVAFILSTVRDTGSGLVPVKRGRVHASPLLRGPWGLAWRLTRGTCAGWVVVMVLLGACYGALFNDIEGFLASSLVYDTVIGVDPDAADNLMESFISFIMLVMAVVAAIPVCLVILKVKAEEKLGRTEAVLAKSVSRVRYLGGFVLIAVLLAAVLLIGTPLGMYGSALLVTKAPPSLDMLLLASLNYLPAVLAVAGLATLLVAAAPRLAPLVWVYLAYCFILAFMGNLVAAAPVAQSIKDLFDILLVTTPFNLLPLYPLEAFNGVLTLGITALSLACMVLGAVVYRSRNIGT